MATNGVSKLGRVALDLGYLNIKQLEECLQIQFDYQKEGKEVPRLGSVLISKNYITTDQLDIILHKQKDAKYETASASTSDILRLAPAGTYIYDEGDDPAQTLFLIHEGQIDFYRGDDLVETIKGKGRFFGVVSYLTSTKYTESAVAARDSKIFAIPSKEVNNFFKTRPEMSLKIARNLARKLHKSILESRVNEPESKSNPDNIDNVIPSDNNSPDVDQDPALSIIEQAKRRQNTPNVESASKQVLTNSKPETQSNAQSIVERARSKNTRPESTSYQPVANSGPSKLPSEESSTTISTENEASTLEVAPDINTRKKDTNTKKQSGKLLSICPLTELDSQKPELITDEVDCSELLSEIDCFQPRPFSKSIVATVKDQISLFLEIEDIDKERTEFLNSLSNPSEVLKAEISRQRKEISKIPPFEAICASYTKLKDLLKSDEAEEPSEVVDIEETTKTEEDPFSDDTDVENAGGENVRAKIDEGMKQAYGYSIKQKDLLIKRYNQLPLILEKCSEYSTNEPFFKMLSMNDIDPTKVFGWGVYYMALTEYSNMQNSKIDKNKLEQLDVDKTIVSLVGRLKISKKAEEERDELLEQLVVQEKQFKLIQSIIVREKNNIQKAMVDEFWEIYNAVAKVLVTDIPLVHKVMARCFLRWGLLGYTSKWIDSTRCCEFIRSCSQALYSPLYSTKSTFIYYSDEIIELTARGYIPTSPNEDLELNKRNSPEWRCDKSYKKHTHLKLQQGILHDVLKEQQGEIQQISDDLAVAENREQNMRASHSKNSRFKSELSALRQEIQSYKVRSTRLKNIVSKLMDEMLPKIIEDSQQAVSNIESSGVDIVIDEIIDHEVKCIRRSSRLVAKLKETFLPFTLRDSYKPDSDIINSRKVLGDSIEKIEERDPIIFSTKLIPSAKRKQRILLRKSPFVLIAPSSGILGFVLSPRTGLENGRLVLPGYFERSMISEDVLLSAFADFRFDCSKAEAGVDVMTSETLVAAYATYRWNMRKKKKEFRKKAAVYLDETERANWRRHYNVYMKSALENGKLLFYKSAELYDQIINVYIDLPENCEKLQR